MDFRDFEGWFIILGFLGILLAFIGFAVIGVDVQVLIGKFFKILFCKIHSIREYLENRSWINTSSWILILIFIISFILIILGYIIIISRLGNEA
jgi:hypothetical protein